MDNSHYFIKYYLNCSQQPEHEEYQYLNTIKSILADGEQKGDRTGTGVMSRFGVQSRYSLRKGGLPWYLFLYI